jgi:hypothetical protein
MKAGMKASATGINIQQSQPGGAKPRRNDVREALQHFVTEVMVLLDFRAQAIGVKGVRVGFNVRALKCQWSVRKFLFSDTSSIQPGRPPWGGGVSFLVDGRNSQGYSRGH